MKRRREYWGKEKEDKKGERGRKIKEESRIRRRMRTKCRMRRGDEEKKRRKMRLRRQKRKEDGNCRRGSMRTRNERRWGTMRSVKRRRIR
jgi:hypothetical protein